MIKTSHSTDSNVMFERPDWQEAGLQWIDIKELKNVNPEERDPESGLLRLFSHYCGETESSFTLQLRVFTPLSKGGASRNLYAQVYLTLSELKELYEIALNMNKSVFPDDKTV